MNRNTTAAIAAVFAPGLAADGGITPAVAQRTDTRWGRQSVQAVIERHCKMFDQESVA